MTFATFSCSITILVNRGYVPRQKIRPDTRVKGQVSISDVVADEDLFFPKEYSTVLTLHSCSIVRLTMELKKQERPQIDAAKENQNAF